MATQLTKHLSSKEGDHSEFGLLNAQWKFDQELIKKALQNVSSVFPHYSRHDASHSRQILTNIERLLGADNLKLLTATDTWLLLEAAYWHDIGMVVTHDHTKKDMESDEFLSYVEAIASQNGHELQGFAKQFKSLDPKSCFAFADTPQDAVSLYRQLLAGWYRKKHPARAEMIVNDPWEEAGIASPRTELVPKRLFRILGMICRLHGSSFEAVLSQLPFAESGMASEKCHPRFVACLLRLGDLFDLDDNRFCPAMLRIAGDAPPSSQAHIQKHAAIRHMRLDPETIELSAQCDGYAAYEATDEWFSWIRDEVRDQMSNWKDIVPQREFGLLPTLGKMEVSLAHGDEILNPGERPRFGVDSEKVIELLQGAGLYENPGQCIRELLQNAVDATLLKAWLTIEGENLQIDLRDPESKEVKQVLDQFPIKVVLSRVSTTPVDGKVNWRIRIEDHGIGVSKQDLQFMRNIGGSSKNLARQAIVRRMPAWFRPSGAFGIGLQSVFLVTDEVAMESKSMLTGDTLSIRMTSPLQRERGMIYIRRFEAHPARQSGTTLEFEMPVDAIPSRISLPGFGGSITQDVLSRFDPVCQLDVPYAAAKVAEEVFKFREFSPIKVDLEFDGEPFLHTKEHDSDQKPIYDDSTGISLIHLKFYPIETAQSRIAFRNQVLENPKPQFAFAGLIANLLSATATEILTINRNEIKDVAHDSVIQQISKAVVASLVHQPNFPATQEERIAASAFLALADQEGARPDLKGLWVDLPLQTTPPTTIRSLCLLNRFSVALMGIEAPWNPPLKPDGIDYALNLNGTHDRRLSLLIHNWKVLMRRYVQVDSMGNLPKQWILQLDESELDPFTDAGLQAAMLGTWSNAMGIAGRFRAPVWKEYQKLAANVQSIGWCRPISDFHATGQQFVLPFFFTPRALGDQRPAPITTQSLDALCAWTHRHSTSGATELEIRRIYEMFIEWVDQDLMKDVSAWRIARGLPA